MPGKSCACSNSTKDAGYPCHKADCPTLKNEACKDNCTKHHCKLCFSIARFEKKQRLTENSSPLSQVGAKSALYSKK